MLKLGLECIPTPHLRELRDLSRFVSELANRKPWSSQPYIGDSAFAHKGGMHVSAVQKHPHTYEHVDPEAVGNHRRVLVSELSGKSNILWKAREYGIDLDRDTPDSRRILDRLKALEDEGFQFEGAEASFELLMERALGRHRPYFELDAYRVIVEEQSAAQEPVAEATVRVRVKGILEHTAAAGNGPVNALDHALRKALEEFYPNLKELRLLDYKVRILDESKGTAAKTRVLITSGDGRETWGTVGVADNIIEASWLALVDSVEYKLRADSAARQPMRILVVDDEPTIVLMCRRVLEAQGHVVHGFTSAQAALAQLEGEAADLLVVDYKMPDLNGLEFIQRAWALRPGLRVVMITAHGTREVISRATQTGVTSIVLKPFTPTELARGVAEAVGDAESPRPTER